MSRCVVVVSRWSVVLLLLSAVPAFGDPILFQDDFEDGNADGWDELRGSWHVGADGWYYGENGTDAYSFAGDESWTDYTMTLQADGVPGGTGRMTIPVRSNKKCNPVTYRFYRCHHTNSLNWHASLKNGCPPFDPVLIDSGRDHDSRSLVQRQAVTNSQINDAGLALHAYHKFHTAPARA